MEIIREDNRYRIRFYAIRNGVPGYAYLKTSFSSPAKARMAAIELGLIKGVKMCVYCMMADWGHNHIPYWNKPMFSEFEEILRRIKALEDKVGGCPEDPSKLEYLNAIRQELEKK